MRGGLKYAEISSSYLFAICKVTIPKPIITSTLIPTNLYTYEITNLTLTASAQIFDYKSTDYLILYFKYSSSANTFAINNLLALQVNSVNCNFTKFN